MNNNINTIINHNNDNNRPTQHHHNPFLTTLQNYTADPTSITMECDYNILHLYALQSNVDSIELVDRLISLYGTDLLLSRDSIQKYTPLFLLATTNKLVSFKHIIQRYSCSILCVDTSGNSIMHWFAEHGNIEMVDYIYNLDQTILSMCNYQRYSPLISAVAQNQFQMVKHLIEKYNANVQQCTMSNENLFYIAIKSDCSIELIDFIIKHDRTCNDHRTKFSYVTPLALCCEKGNLQLLKHLIQQYNFNIYELSRDHWSLLHNAVLSNNTEMIQYISTLFETTSIQHFQLWKLPYGYPSLTGEWFPKELTALHIGIQHSKLDSVRQLIRLKANIGVTNTITSADSLFSSILTYAYFFAHENNNYTIFKYLLSDELFHDWNEQKTLKFGYDSNSIYIQYDPIQPQFTIETEPFDGHPVDLVPLLHAAHNHDRIAIELLLERNADINVVDKQKCNLYHHLARSDYDQNIDGDDDNDDDGDNDEANTDDENAFESNGSIISIFLQRYAEQSPVLLSNYNYRGHTPFFTAICASQVHGRMKGTDDNDFQNVDIQSFINYDSKLLLQKTQRGETILHIGVHHKNDAYFKNIKFNIEARLTGLIEAVIDNIDIIL